ncbi:MAG TPA: CHAT domain-containing protein [Planctomycetota bacterium]|nr:CHAT domain-containing protein [Planctomycetota bacterium]
MKPGRRIRIPCAAALAALLALGSGATTVGQREEAKGPACASELERFRERLGRLRGGDESVLADLRAIAERLCADCGRCDAIDVADYYAELDAAARAQGLADERRYRALRAEVFEAGRSDGAALEWAADRERVLEELRELAGEVAERPDFVPAAQALALCALIELRTLEAQPGFDLAARDALAKRIAEDCARSLELYERSGLATPRLEPRWIESRLQLQLGRFGEARAGFETCLAAAERAGNDEYKEHALQGLLALARLAGDSREMERLLTRVAAFRDPRQSWPLARAWAERLLASDHAEEALEFLERCAPGTDAHVSDRIDWDVLTGSALMRLGRGESAQARFERLAAGPAPELGVIPLARLEMERGEPSLALQRLSSRHIEGFSPRAIAAALALQGEAKLAAGDLGGADDIEDALELADRWSDSMVVQPLHDRMVGVRGLAEGSARSVIDEWMGLHAVALLADARVRQGRSLEALRIIEDAQSRSLRREDDELRRLRTIAGLDARRRVLTGDEIAAWARHCELGLVTWVVGADFTVVGHAVQDGGGAPDVWAARLPLGRRAVLDAVRRLREATLSGQAERAKALSEEIAAALLPAALQARLCAQPANGDGVKPRALFLLHGPLEELALELLPLDGASIDEKLIPLVLPGLPEAAPGMAPAREAMARWRLLGDPLDEDRRPLLEGAAAELKALAGLHPGSQLATRASFDRSSVVSALGGSAPVHIASHLRPDCAREALRLTPASLVLSGADSICSHQLAELGPRLPLVVLSACESGGGELVDAQGLQGLARAFLESGTRNLLVTLWPVEDRAAQAFATAFHRLLAEGESPSRAASRARTALRRSGLAPADWAAFRLLGRD